MLFNNDHVKMTQSDLLQYQHILTVVITTVVMLNLHTTCYIDTMDIYNDYNIVEVIISMHFLLQ